MVSLLRHNQPELGSNEGVEEGGGQAATLAGNSRVTVLTTAPCRLSLTDYGLVLLKVNSLLLRSTENIIFHLENYLLSKRTWKGKLVR